MQKRDVRDVFEYIVIIVEQENGRKSGVFVRLCLLLQVTLKRIQYQHCASAPSKTSLPNEILQVSVVMGDASFSSSVAVFSSATTSRGIDSTVARNSYNFFRKFVVWNAIQIVTHHPTKQVNEAVQRSRPRSSVGK